MLKIIELFAGIGAPRKALEFANISHKTIWFSEIDKYAENSYRAIFNDYETPNLGDITKIDVNNLQKEEVDIIIGGWPCQDILIAGKRKGMDKDSDTCPAHAAGVWYFVRQSGTFMLILLSPFIVPRCKSKISCLES
ncbi:DNA cytosine methyltransferase [Spiroplasma endosymbiont of Sarcophaga variegata]|uniref:DNA cytosine methyltransferase n=1 Tax=unclassified Spiroplasma TaxID=2637901 RepID=UPI003AF5EB3F